MVKVKGSETETHDIGCAKISDHATIDQRLDHGITVIDIDDSENDGQGRRLGKMSYEDLLEIKNFGSKSADEVIEALERIGISIPQSRTSA